MNSPSRFAPSLVREVANTAMGRPDVLPFWFGESDQPTPAFIREAAIESIRNGETFYTENLARLYLREAIATYLTGLHNQPFASDRISVTSSGDSALMLSSQLLIHPGDRVVIITPLWPNAVEIPKITGAIVECISLEVRDNRWTLPLDKLLAALTPNTRMLVINSPNNPTGWTITPEDQQTILDHCRRNGTWILADDVYERLVFTGANSAPSFLRITTPDDRLISVNSFSKAWTMTGWRVGWMTVPTDLLSDLGPLIEYNTSCAPEFAQRGATAAALHGEPCIQHLRTHLTGIKAQLTSALRELPRIQLPEADGAMYAFFRIEGETDSVSIAKRLINEAGLGLAPGRAFGPEGEGWLRWCYSAQWPKIEQGIDRLTSFLA